jgi:hypothetical protein
MLPLLLASPSGAGSPIVMEGSSATADDGTVPHRLRSGLIAGFALGGGMGAGVGYPNNSNDIGKLHHTASGWMPGVGGTLLVMGALADYVNVGFWYAHATFGDDGRRASQDGVGLRVEAFPLVALSPGWAGLGAFSEFGFGTAKLNTPNQPQVAGTQSMIGVGVLYEWSVAPHFLGGHLGVGPSLEYDAVFTTPYDQNGVIANLRLVFYGGP